MQARYNYKQRYTYNINLIHCHWTYISDTDIIHRINLQHGTETLVSVEMIQVSSTFLFKSREISHQTSNEIDIIKQNPSQILTFSCYLICLCFINHVLKIQLCVLSRDKDSIMVHRISYTPGVQLVLVLDKLQKNTFFHTLNIGIILFNTFIKCMSSS